jgi:hypothetical protein
MGTLALVIRALGLETEEAGAHELAAEWWSERHQHAFEREAVG